MYVACDYVLAQRSVFLEDVIFDKLGWKNESRTNHVQCKNGIA